MKKAFLIGVMIIFSATAAWADLVDQELPGATPEQVKNSTRQMVKQGFDTEDRKSVV